MIYNHALFCWALILYQMRSFNGPHETEHFSKQIRQKYFSWKSSKFLIFPLKNCNISKNSKPSDWSQRCSTATCPGATMPSSQVRIMLILPTLQSTSIAVEQNYYIRVSSRYWSWFVQKAIFENYILLCTLFTLLH